MKFTKLLALSQLASGISCAAVDQDGYFTPAELHEKRSMAIPYDEKTAADAVRRIVAEKSYLEINTFSESPKFPFSSSMYHISPDCFDGLDHNGFPLIVLSDMNRNYVNYKQNGLISFSLRATSSRYVFDGPRFTLIGYLKKLERSQLLEDAFRKVHPKIWIPGKSPYPTDYYQLQVQNIYFVVDDGYRGFISPETYANAAKPVCLLRSDDDKNAEIILDNPQ